jgi:TAT (twin-arginine translocation) pathway-exported protein
MDRRDFLKLGGTAVAAGALAARNAALLPIAHM